MTAPRRPLPAAGLGLVGWLLLGCTPDVREGQFTCLPGDPGACPDGWICLAQGSEFRCARTFTSHCGNGRIDPGEQCDGTPVDPGACAAAGFPGVPSCLDDCRLFCAYCGNGALDGAEACDDGEGNSPLPDAACRPDCTPGRCGDGVVDTGEQCDEGLANSDAPGATCRLACTRSQCGDGRRDGLEACDDGNLADGDGCGAACTLEPGWTCLGAAPSTCLPAELLVFTPVPAGTFTMGSPEDEVGRSVYEPLHEVTLTRPFEVLTTEVTQDLFTRIMGFNPSAHLACGPLCPVENVSWYDAAIFCNALSERADLEPCYDCQGAYPDAFCGPAAFPSPYDCPGYRLPTEAEWEYAARAGTTGGTYHGTSTQRRCERGDDTLVPLAWYCSLGGDGPRPVAGKAANPWGLFDLLGNVKEWTNDWFITYGLPGSDPQVDPVGPLTGSSKLTRGGGYLSPAMNVRCAAPGVSPPAFADDLIGFRPVRTLP